MELSKGNIVNTTAGRGVVVDRMSYAGEVLVRLDRGTAFDREHGQWFDECDVVRVGHDSSALVWRPLSRSGMGPAGPDLIKRYRDEYVEAAAVSPVPEWSLSARRGQAMITYPDHAPAVRRNDLDSLLCVIELNAGTGHVAHYSPFTDRVTPADHRSCAEWDTLNH
jgi:hypothetical protein